jgi:hypothetical protein
MSDAVGLTSAYTAFMRRLVLLAVIVFVFAAVVPGAAQTHKAPSAKAAPKKSAPAKPITARPEMTFPAVLGTGVRTKREFCDVMAGRDPQAGIVVRIPPHRGDAVLTFDLHNREMYSEQTVREGRAYTRHTATIGVLALDGTLLARAVVDTEFRSAKDLLDRVGGGAGPGGVKAVAPIGDESVRVDIPEDVDAVSLLGEKLLAVTVDGTETFTASGRPIAILSNVMIEYRPVPPPKTKTPTKKKKQPEP